MIIVDTNVLLSFLLTDGITRRIIKENPDVFMSPEHCFEELWEHRERWNRNKLKDSELLEIMEDIKRLFVMPVSQEVYNSYISEAAELTDDKDDSPVIALALAADNEGIWTYNIKHFRQEIFGERIRVLSTGDVIELCPLKES